MIALSRRLRAKVQPPSTAGDEVQAWAEDFLRYKVQRLMVRRQLQGVLDRLELEKVGLLQRAWRGGFGFPMEVSQEARSRLLRGKNFVPGSCVVLRPGELRCAILLCEPYFSASGNAQDEPGYFCAVDERDRHLASEDVVHVTESELKESEFAFPIQAGSHGYSLVRVLLDAVQVVTLGPAALAVRPSTVPGAGLGLFAAEDIEPFIIIGEYTGEVKDLASYGAKVDRLGHSELHPFYLRPGLLVDPTDEHGCLHPESLSMAFTNEAPLDGEYNTLALYCLRAGLPPAVFFCTQQLVRAGSELFVCYGYDHPRQYPFAEPTPEADALQRREICARHPQLCPDFPPPVETVDHPTVSNELRSQDKAEMQAMPAAMSNFEVGTEQWRTDLSDVVLPTPAYDSDSD
ncbi:unnamed protein product [Symbiodinium sp. KB8]|nr:unnamed protein product [Symbiodinium sp. KB8]